MRKLTTTVQGRNWLLHSFYQIYLREVLSVTLSLQCGTVVARRPEET